MVLHKKWSSLAFACFEFAQNSLKMAVVDSDYYKKQDTDYGFPPLNGWDFFEDDKQVSALNAPLTSFLLQKGRIGTVLFNYYY